MLQVAADLLSAEVHSDAEAQLSGEILTDLNRLSDEEKVDVDNLGIWIDPIGRNGILH